MVARPKGYNEKGKKKKKEQSLDRFIANSMGASSNESRENQQQPRAGNHYFLSDISHSLSLSFFFF